MRTIEALVISANEPQLERCLESVKSQTVPFSRITHVNNVSPENVALNSGISMVRDQLAMKIDGDFILYPNAVETALKRIPDEDTNQYAYNFILHDCFLKQNIRGCGVLVMPVIRKVPYPNLVCDDIWVGSKLRRMGFIIMKYPEVVGTHFDSPDEFQVFRRFYIMGVKHGKRFSWNYLMKLYQDTGDPLYELAMRAVEFGMRKKAYPTSHNLDFDQRMFGEFRASEPV